MMQWLRTLAQQMRPASRDRAEKAAWPAAVPWPVPPPDQPVTRFATIRCLVVCYVHTSGGYIPQAARAALRRGVELARLFIWRNSLLHLNVEVDYLDILEYRQVDADQVSGLHRLAHDLMDRGIERHRYGGFLEVAPSASGTWAWGVVSPEVVSTGPGTWLHDHGFAHTDWPVPTDVRYPGADPATDYRMTWIFVHEFGHVIDALYRRCGHEDMLHGDIPFAYGPPCGEHFSYQAHLLRRFDGYLALRPPYGEVVAVLDRDGDGVPDDEPRVPLDERRFGSDPLRPDTDDDGLDDHAELVAGIYTGTDPRRTDTDGDGLADGSDPYPLYALSPLIHQSAPDLDRPGWDGWTELATGPIFSSRPDFTATLYASWSPASLWLGVATNLPAEVWFYLDGSATGWWQRRDNLEIGVDPWSQAAPIRRARCLDASAEVRAATQSVVWQDEERYTWPPVVLPDDVAAHTSCSAAGTWECKVRVQPSRLPEALRLTADGRIGLRVVFERMAGQEGVWASFFEAYEFVTVRLGATPPT